MQYTVFCCSKLALLRLLLVVFFCCRCVIEDDEETALTEDVEAKAKETDTIMNMGIKNLLLCVLSKTFDQTYLPFC